MRYSRLTLGAIVFIVTSLVTTVAFAQAAGKSSKNQEKTAQIEIAPTPTPPNEVANDDSSQQQVNDFLTALNKEQEKAAALSAAPTPQPTPPATPAPSTDHSSRWDQLAQCESGGNWAINTGNGFGGGLQFMHGNGYSTWLSFGGGEFAPNPWDATREQQIVIAERVLASSGWNAWPGCSRKFGWL